MIAVRSAVHTEFADPTFLTECRAVGTGFAADITDHSTVAAVMAVLTHCIGTIYTDSAVRTEFINATRAFTAVRTNIFAAILTDNAALITDFGAISTQLTVLAEPV